MSIQTLAARPTQTVAPIMKPAPVAKTAATRVRKPGIYRGLDGAEFGLWRARLRRLLEACC
jgi:hypothetical protein